MSDFLDRLIERSLGLAPVVRPRLPSLFEPPSADAAVQTEQEATGPTPTSLPRAAHADEHERAGLTDDAPARRRTPPREFTPHDAYEPPAQPSTSPSQAATNVSHRTEPGDYAPPESHRPAHESPPQPAPRETRTPATLPLPLAPQPPPRVEHRAEFEKVARAFTPPPAAGEQSMTVIHLTHHEPGAAAPVSFEPPTRREPVGPEGANAAGRLSELGQQVEGLRQHVERMQFRPAAAELRVETRTVEGRKVVERVAESPSPAPKRAEAPAPVERRPAHTPPQAPVFVQPRATLRAAQQAEAHEHAHARAAEPTVNVTIGRIEVRASQAADSTARQERREQTPAAMSLREYLRKRSGGHSR